MTMGRGLLITDFIDIFFWGSTWKCDGGEKTRNILEAEKSAVSTL